MATSIVENPEEKRSFRQVQPAPPLAEQAAIENLHKVMPVEMAPQSKAILNNANAALGNQLKRTLSSCMKLAKGAFGSVSSVFSVFSGLKRIAGGI
jgi:hypothetical protein